MTSEEIIKIAERNLKQNFVDRDTMQELLSVAKLQETEIKLSAESIKRVEEENKKLYGMIAVDYSLDKLIEVVNDVLQKAISYEDTFDFSGVKLAMDRLLDLVDQNEQYHISIERYSNIPYFEINKEIEIH